jgi:hypothetical protein
MNNDGLKQELLKILTRADVSQNEVDKIIKIRTVGSRFLSVQKLPIEQFCIIYNFYDFDLKKVIDRFAKIRDIKRDTIKNKIYIHTAQLNKLGLNNIDELLEKKKENYEKIKDTLKKQKEVNNIVDKVKDFVSFFNISTDGLTNRIKDIQDKGNKSKEDYIKELYILRELFIAKAKGELTTQQTETLWEVELDETTNKYVKKQIYKNKANKQVLSIRTQSHLPDEKSLVAIKILDEMILQAESSNDLEITEEEITEKYRNYIRDAEKERQLMLEASIN